MLRPEEVWKRYWKTSHFNEWDEQCDCVYYALTKSVDLEGVKCLLETGSGTGRVSIKASEEYKCRTVLLDVSLSAIKLSKKLGQKFDTSSSIDYAVGSIFSLPFREAVFDLAWSGGVLEHFTFEQRQSAINETLRVLKNHGKCVVIVPSRYALVYNCIRVISIKLGTWMFGREEPFARSDFLRLRPRPLKIWSLGFFMQGVSYVPFLTFLWRVLCHMVKHLSERVYSFMNKRLPGYLIVALFMKTSETLQR